MILQETHGKQIVYVPDIEPGHIALGEMIGVCDVNGKVAMHGSMEKLRYTTDCGMTVDAWRLTGQTITALVLPDRVRIQGSSGRDIANAFNSFESPRFDFPPYTFVGKFSALDGRKCLYDKVGREISTCMETVKDIRGIFELMSHLGADGGALFHPVIARYMWGIWHSKNRPSRLQPVGYVDLRLYLKVMRDDRKYMFSTQHANNLLAMELGKNPTVRVTGVDSATGQALLAIDDATVIDTAKDKSFNPYVIIANRPFEIRQEMPFQWTRVDFQGHPVFLMPVMALKSAFGSMRNMLDLLSTTQTVA